MSVTDTLAGETHYFAYDDSYRVSSETQGSRGVIAHTYDTSDRTDGYAVTDGPFATYEYYPDGSLKDVAWSPISGQFQYAYTLNGQYSTIMFPDAQHRDYTYDDQGRLLRIANEHPEIEGFLAVYNYGYDFDAQRNPSFLGQRTTMRPTDSIGFHEMKTNYSYDLNNQLIGDEMTGFCLECQSTHNWTYDAIGNRISFTKTEYGQLGSSDYTYYKNGTNQLNGQWLQSVQDLSSTVTFGYDANGNQLMEIRPNGTYNLTWDFENRLTGISGPDVTVAYQYDYLGRRISKTVDGNTTTYLYNGQNLIAEQGASVADYFFGPGIDEPLAMFRANTVYYYDIDGLGSVTALNDPDGQIMNQYGYDSWGNAVAEETVPSPFTYTARETGETGLMYYRARYMNPTIGRFISEDPKKGGDPNDYRYVSANPIAFIDPLGLDCTAILKSKMKSDRAGAVAFIQQVLVTCGRGMTKVRLTGETFTYVPGGCGRNYPWPLGGYIFGDTPPFGEYKYSWIYDCAFEHHPNYDEQYEELVDTIGYEGYHQGTHDASEPPARAEGRLAAYEWNAINAACSCPLCK